ncbi:MAG: HigA family addiction module antidote protein [Treponema sp.]|jgi:addiction module HigA family antidote|nr:HigA family addiction module antidote protein [Treponema sp.]
MAKKIVQSPGSVLNALLDEYQLSTRKLALDVKLSQPSVYKLVKGQGKLTVPTALRLAKYFGTSPEYWLDLQRKADLAEAAGDAKFTAILKAIVKAKKPAPVKAAKAKAGVKPKVKQDRKKRAAPKAKTPADAAAPKKRGRKPAAPRVRPTASPVPGAPAPETVQ